MAQRSAKAVWYGGLKTGKGTIELGSGKFKGQYSFQSRFESGPGTNPEELIGGAHAACFSMALAAGLEKAGYPPESIETTARVALNEVQDGFAITTIELDTRGHVPGINEDTFLEQARIAKDNCPVSRVLTGARISLKARLISEHPVTAAP
ncbi:MAG: peroxiredoxin [Planctomycetes bacterium RBG_13_62_9]|nr:MAG: peroxiredoxin [Planctomycetes bacterium RBG_13_62_9]